MLYTRFHFHPDLHGAVRLFRPGVALALLVALSGCAQPQGGPSQGGAAAEPEARGPAVLTLAILREPRYLVSLSGGASRTGGAHNPRYVAHNTLVVPDEGGTYQPQLAAELPSIEAGTWRLNPDGTMDTTWKLRANIRWHDGTPFTSDDLLFTLGAKQAPEICCPPGRPELMKSATAPDPYTFVIHWAETYVDADKAQEIEPWPRHLLESAFRRDPEAFINNPWFTTEFVGLGPYRLVRWEPGSHMEFSRFDGYFRGRPPLDSVILRFLDEPNALVASILAGAVDAVLSPGLSVDAAIEVRRRWEGTGHQVRFNVGDNFENIQVQFRPEFARPASGLTLRPVRQAFYQAIDRQTLVEVVSHGLAPVADSWYSPAEALRPQIEAGIPQLPYDPARAQALLAQAGWTRGPDGALVHGQTGERFEIELRANQEVGIEREQNVIGDNWRAVGAQVAFNVVPVARQRDNEYAASFPGAYLFFSGGPAYASFRLHSKQAATAANRWSGRNRGGYSNPRVDAVLDRLVVTIDPGIRLGLHRELLQEQMGDVAVMPLYWFVNPLLFLKGVKIPPVPGGEVTASFFDWDRSAA